MMSHTLKVVKRIMTRLCLSFWFYRPRFYCSAHLTAAWLHVSWRYSLVLLPLLAVRICSACVITPEYDRLNSWESSIEWNICAESVTQPPLCDLVFFLPLFIITTPDAWNVDQLRLKSRVHLWVARKPFSLVQLAAHKLFRDGCWGAFTRWCHREFTTELLHAGGLWQPRK